MISWNNYFVLTKAERFYVAAKYVTNFFFFFFCKKMFITRTLKEILGSAALRIRCTSDATVLSRLTYGMHTGAESTSALVI